MAKIKALTPQELYRQKKQREERERLAYLPPGLINHGNTCFMNSVLQGLIATRLLSDLVHFNSIPPEIQSTLSTHIVSRRSPQLTNGHNLGGIYEQPWVNTMPIGDMFLNVMYKSWDIQANRRREVLSPKALLGALGQKYDQYLDFAQQDAHEFLRILLDAMRMEEQDIIKKRQPPTSTHHKKRRRTTVTANSVKNSNSATPVSSTSTAPATHDTPELDPLLPFADMLFGGKLTSILVCQKCKHVSQTYEDFNDISLSIKPEDYFFGRGSNGRGRKREKLKNLAKRLTTFSGSGGGGSHATQSSNSNTNSTTTMTTEPDYQTALSSMEMQRSSSVPPSQSHSRAADGSTHMDGEDDGHSSFVEHPRRKSLDLTKMSVVGGISKVDVDVETPPSSGAEAENQADPLQSVPSEEITLEPSEQGTVAAFENREKGDKSQKNEMVMESDSSGVPIHVVPPEERDMELIETTKDKEKDKKDDVGWAKLSRRISTMTGGLGRSKDKEKRDRKPWSMDRSESSLAVKEKVEVTGSPADGSMQKSTSDSGISQETIGFNTRPEIPRISSEGRINTVAAGISSTSANPASNHVPGPIAVVPSSSSSGSISTAAYHLFRPLPRASSFLSTSTLNDFNTSSTITPLFPSVQRSRSPKPPKPTAPESEYLRKILADVVPSSQVLNSPFSLFKPPALLSGAHPFSTSTSGLTGSSGSGGGTGLWLGLKQLSGIEECLRLFTAVEVLDGENMVGCRRCWKIANGVFDVKNSTKQEEEEDDSDQEEQEESDTGENGLINQDQVALTDEGGLKRPRPVLEALSIANINAPIHIPTSMSTPTVSFYTLPNSSDSRSISSLPVETTSVLDGNEDLTLVEFSVKESGDNRSLLRGPGGMPIPVISTTSPLDTPLGTSFERAQRLAQENMIEPFVMNGTGDNTRTINGVLSDQGFSINSSSTSTVSSTYVTPLSSVPSGSKDSLLIPKTPRRRRRQQTYDSSTSASASATDNESSDDDESDTSLGTSASGESAVATDSIPQQKSQGQQQQQAQAAPQQSPNETSTQQTKPKEKKPKPVVMRPAYKRYLISLPPPVLVIHLKRFQQTSKMPLISFSHGLKKLDDYISFPEYLDLKPFLAPKKEDYGLGKKKKKKAKTKEDRCMYRLYAVVVHIGNMLGGHYIAYTALPTGSGATPGSSEPALEEVDPMPESTEQHSTSKTESVNDERQWAFISDTAVRLATVEEVLHAKAYICMYERC